jgi:hypothetical protein
LHNLDLFKKKAPKAVFPLAGKTQCLAGQGENGKYKRELRERERERETPRIVPKPART